MFETTNQILSYILSGYHTWTHSSDTFIPDDITNQILNRGHRRDVHPGSLAEEPPLWATLTWAVSVKSWGSPAPGASTFCGDFEPQINHRFGESSYFGWHFGMQLH